MRVSIRRYHLDCFLKRLQLNGKVLDIAGKKVNKRGEFIPNESGCTEWCYLNIEEASKPDIIASFDALPIKSNYYDNALLIEAIEYAEFPDTVLKEIYRILTPGGKIIISTPLFCAIHNDNYDRARYTKYEIERKLSKANFSNILINKNGSLFSCTFDFITTYLTRSNPKIYKKIIKRIILSEYFMNFIIYLDNIADIDSITTGYTITAVK